MTVCRGAAKAKVTNTSIIQQGGLMMLNGAIACGAGYLIAWAIAEMMVSTDRLLTIFLAGLRSHTTRCSSHTPRLQPGRGLQLPCQVDRHRLRAGVR